MYIFPDLVFRIYVLLTCHLIYNHLIKTSLSGIILTMLIPCPCVSLANPEEFSTELANDKNVSIDMAKHDTYLWTRQNNQQRGVDGNGNRRQLNSSNATYVDFVTL